MTSHPTASTTQAERILSFWHKVEFFVSPDLTELGAGYDGVIKYPQHDLENRPACLPWLDRSQLSRARGSHNPDTPYKFKLYLGVFYRSEIFRIARECYPESADGPQERDADEGQTCSMTVMVDEYGRIQPDSFKFSTAPWALGEVIQGRLDAMTMQAFEGATQQFRDRLTTIVNVADNVKREHGLPRMLTTFELIEMLKAMADWTSFSTERPGAPAMYVQMFKLEDKRAIEAWQHAQRPCLTAESLHLLATELPIMLQSEVRGPIIQQEPREPDLDKEVDTSDEIAILNSFFIRDIERVINTLKSAGLAPGSPLARYLEGNGEKQPDLLLPEGQAALMEMVAPKRIPNGRWPGEDKQSMSLMQQFAINTIDHELKETGLYSVNGPPGTGKTTMLRDLVARNVVKRAEILASLSSPEAAFGKPICAYIQDEKREIKTLIPALTGFEMVVVSSNNAAVENVTQELPQIKAIGESFKSLEYLKPVAQKLAAKHKTKNGQVHIFPLAPEEECWGLIATALGNNRNRKRFGEHVFYKKIDGCIAKNAASSYLTFIPALNARASKCNPKQLFKDAQSSFSAAEQHVQTIHSELARLQQLQRLKAQVEISRRHADVHKRFAARVALWLSNKRAKRLPFWAIAARAKKHSTIKQIELRFSRAEHQAAVSKQRLESLKLRFDDEQQAYASLVDKYSDVLLPDREINLETPDIQRTSFGHGQALNKARSELTARAFELHEAWLVATYTGGNNLWPTIKSLMPMLNSKVENRDTAKALWQMLFMFVPVVSSTFASVARQFQILEESDIGWLFIDEAGQATPQQAVGALWRAKRAVVVGDPLQIEPVFTVPAPLVEAMANKALGDEGLDWSPTTVSVQILADRVNPYGTRQITDSLWVGSPLRVHRRCQEPMFSIANKIAYNDKMLHGNSDLASGPNGSVWIDIEGEVDGRHFVPSQADAVYDLLMDHIQQNPLRPPEFYIISPFKEVANRLKKYLSEQLSAPCFKSKEELKAWLKTHIGTVHTFQGKEERNVILVLGLSKAKPGAADWASSTPNILNVALTRAKERVYVIGSSEIWGGKNYFVDAKRQLGTAEALEVET
ncbi:DEAD/DEAH box helicase [Vreelandella venusta]|uniref:DEAD/DEAH box helicase n=1 Tax=Vreelandella venusta TaxID=44935 RepID=UPI0018DA8837|nr:DEAD/DEAH box helicase [Halomonas venusta]QPI64102.1 hypothetical protein IR195_20115 [Halomonas venusta]